MTESGLMEDEPNNETQKIVKDLQSIQPNFPASEFEGWKILN